MRLRISGADESTRTEAVLTLGIPTPIGRLYLAATPRALIRIELPSARAELRLNVWLALHFPMAPKRNGVNPILKKSATELEAYFTGGLTEFSIALELWGTSFQTEAWKAVARIPHGKTVTYAEIASAIGRPRAVRAVGAAQAVNPLPVVIPCHRVIGTDGQLTGYAGGLAVKRWLLDHESAQQDRGLDAPRLRRTRRPLMVGPSSTSKSQLPR
jgi:methylated-DNA-[protein]-cysteine S-methyltransferase